MIPQKMWLREHPTADYIPYRTHVDQYTVKTANGDYIQCLRLDGISHESADEESIESWKNQLNMLLKNIASPDIALSTYVLRREENTPPEGRFGRGFAQQLNDKYQERVLSSTMMINELYLVITHCNLTPKAAKLFSKVLPVAQKHQVDRIHEIVALVMAGLGHYGPSRLGVYEKNGTLFSEILEFFGYLVNGEWQTMPLPRAPINEVIGTSRPFFGRETFELRGVAESTFGACIGAKEYPEITAPGMINALLSAPFPIILTQTFRFISRAVALEMMRRQRQRMRMSHDVSESLIEEIDIGMDDLASGRFVMGEHHLVLSILAKSQKELKGNIVDARQALTESGIVVAREDLALEAAFWSQLPGNFSYRPRPSPINSRNFAGFSSFHNFPSGRAKGNHWGPAISLLKTSSGTPYYLNFHAPLDSQVNTTKQEAEDARKNSSQIPVGNTMIIGPAGSGKTVIQGFTFAQAQKYNADCVVFDKDRGLEICIRAQRGIYLALQTGKPTGFNPFKLPATEENLFFLEKLVIKLVEESKYSVSKKEEQEISDAIRAVMTKLSPSMRKLGNVLPYLDQTNPEGAGARLRKWCGQGTHAWVFDNPDDRLDFNENPLHGFDMTTILNHEEIRTPVVMYLFHRLEQIIDGRRLMVYMDEFWKLLLDTYFLDFTNNKIKTIRKLDGIFIMGTQSPKDVINSPIAHSLIEQTATFIFMPNPKANREDYVNGFHLSEREYQIIKEDLLPTSRQFLVKQGHQSVVAELDLKGFDDELAVISGNGDTVALMHKIIEQVGDDPDAWLPLFQQQRRMTL
ncbi:MAG: VirB4 family type IV secretion/conjugal transfer ATPase [Flavobacteriales bacterium]|nr:VirB4 family type IV secretion/conjugal transfer ATPase [Flavobacteriales bacterium]